MLAPFLQTILETSAVVPVTEGPPMLMSTCLRQLIIAGVRLLGTFNQHLPMILSNN